MGFLGPSISEFVLLIKSATSTQFLINYVMIFLNVNTTLFELLITP